MAIVFLNNFSTVTVNPLAPADTTLELQDGIADIAAALTGGNTLVLTLFTADDQGAETQREIIHVTAVDEVAGTLTIERGKEGTAAGTWAPNTGVEQRLTAGALDEMRRSFVTNNAGESGAVAIGEGASTADRDDTAIGRNADTGMQGDGTAVGSGAAVADGYGTALGAASSAEGSYGVAVGGRSESTADNAMAVGGRSVSSGSGGMAMGYAASCTSENGMAMGYNTSCTSENGIAMGYAASCTSKNGVAVGGSAYCPGPGEYQTAVGNYAEAGAEYATALGANAYATAKNATAIGDISASVPDGTAIAGFQYAGSYANSAAQIVVPMDALDLTSSGDFAEVTLPAGTIFFIEQIDVICTSSIDVTGTAAQVQVGPDDLSPGDYLAATAFDKTAAGQRESHNPLVVDGVTSVRASVAAAGTGTDHKAKVVVRGYLLEM